LDTKNEDFEECENRIHKKSKFENMFFFFISFMKSNPSLQVIRLKNPRQLPKMKKTNIHGFYAPINPNMTWTS